MMVEGRKLNLTVGLLIVGIVVTLSSPGFSYAATFELHPIGPGRFDSWVLGGSDSPGLADSKIDAVSTSDGNGSYLYRQADSKRQTFAFPPIPVPDNAIVESVIIHANATRVDDLDSTLELSVEYGTSGQKYSDAAEGIVPTGIWNDMKRNMTINPFTGNNWTGAEINSWTLNGDDIYFGVNNQKRQGSEIRVTEVWLEVNVKDNPPEIFVPDNWPDVEATNRTDTRVDFSANVTATDDYTPEDEILIECTPVSGSGFSIENSTDPGHLKEITHTVTCTATDNSGQTDTDSFNIKIVDTTPPIFTVLPTNPDSVDAIGINTPVDIDTQTLEAFDLVSLSSEITISDNRTDVASALANSEECNSALTCFYAGSTTVTYTATDFANNSNSSATQTVTVNPLPLVMEWDEDPAEYSINLGQAYLSVDDYRGNVNNSKKDSILVHVSTNSSSGIDVLLKEDQIDSHNFTAPLNDVIITLDPTPGSTDESAGIIEAHAEDTITATYNTTPSPEGSGIPDSESITAEAVDPSNGSLGATPTSEQRLTYGSDDVLIIGSGTPIYLLTGADLGDPQNDDSTLKTRFDIDIKSVDPTGNVIQSGTMQMVENTKNNDSFHSKYYITATDDAALVDSSIGYYDAPVGSRIIAEYTALDGQEFSVTLTVVDDPGLELVTYDIDPAIKEPCGADLDADGICDEYELASGLTIPITDEVGDIIVEYHLPCGPGTTDPTCPSPDRKDLYVEVDYMPGHKLDPVAIDQVTEAFDIAPVINVPTNPDPTKYGVALHVIVDENIQLHRNVIPLSSADPANPGFQQLKKQWFGSALERGCEIQLDPSNEPVTVCPALTADEQQDVVDILNAKRQVFHYALIAHSLLDQETSSGWGELPGNDFIVTLGNFAGATSDNNSGVGSTDQQAVTFMHELGHNLGLSHNGKDIRNDYNCASNYLSIMNYEFQFLDLVSDRPLDYSRINLPAIWPETLDESIPVAEYVYDDPISGPRVLNTAFGYLDGAENVAIVVPTGGEDYPDVDGDGSPDVAGKFVDWNQDGSFDTSGTTFNLPISNIGIPGCDTGLQQSKMKSWNDWANIKFDFQSVPSTFASGAYHTPAALSEIDIEKINQIQASLLDVLATAVLDSTTITNKTPITDEILVIDDLVLQNKLEDYEDGGIQDGAISKLIGLRPLISPDDEASNILETIIATYQASVTPSAVTDHEEAQIPIADAGGQGGGDVFTNFYQADEGQLLQLDGSQSTDPDRCEPETLCTSIEVFDWQTETNSLVGQFNEDTSQPILNSTWGQTGGENKTTYLISLIVTDDGIDGTATECEADPTSPTCTATYPDGPKTSLPDTIAILIFNVAPTIVGDVADATINEGTSFDIDVDFTDPGFLDHHTATIDWGDGIIEPGNVDETDGNGNVTASHQYSVGEWTGTITVDDGDGGTSSDSFAVTVLNIPPTVTFTSEPPSEIIYGQEVTIAGTIDDSSTEFTVTVFWEADTIEVVPTGEDFSVSYEYLQVTDGTYQLKIVVCDDTDTPEGCVPFEFTINVNYNIPENPFNSPVPGAQYEQGRTIPVKFSVLDFNDNPVDGATVLLYWESVADGIEHDAVDKKGSNQATLKQDVYQLNIETDEMPLGDVIIRVTTDDGQFREQTVEIK